MGFSHLLSNEASLANFREVFNIPGDMDVAYCHEGDIALHRCSGSNKAFFPLMANPRGRGYFKSNYYLKARDVWVRLISCLPDSNRNSVGEYVRVSDNWLADELPCPLSSCEVGRYRAPLFFYLCFPCDYFA